MFKSFEDIKRVGEKFSKGKIVPARVLKATDRISKINNSKLKFGCDMYLLSCNDGRQVFAVDWNDANTTSLFTGPADLNMNFTGNPYSDKGNIFIGNVATTNQEWIDRINKFAFNCNFLK